MLPRTTSRVVDTRIRGGMNPNHRVREVLEHGRFEEHDPFLMLAEDWFVRGTFGDHPHRGFETVTFILEGSVEHRDNHGGHGVLYPGDAQWMTAGRGVIHSEEAGPDGAHSLQLWINLPSKSKMVEPRYQDLRGAEMPVRRENGAVLRVFSGSSGGVTVPTLNHTPVTMVEMRLEAGTSVMQDVPSSYNAFIYVISGKARFAANETAARAGQVVWFSPIADEETPTAIAIRAESDTHAILWGGRPIRERVTAHGPFVMNTHEEIHQAIVDFQMGRF
jgi:redox-sensitive bicupin YhaK (pirin superfamily)